MRPARQIIDLGRASRSKLSAANNAMCEKDKSLFDDLSNNAGSYSSSAFTNRESQSLFDRDRGDQADRHHDVVARHAHFSAFRKLQIAGYVCCSEIELRSVSIEERGVSSAFFLLQYVYLSFELCMRMDGSRLASTCPLSISFLCTPLSSAPMLSPVSA